MAAKRCLSAALAAASIAVVAPGQASAKTYSVNVVAQARWTGSSLAVNLSGKPIGSCQGTAALKSYGVLFKSRCKGGRVTVRVRYATGDQSRGTWRLVSGIGRYKNASGTGKFSGSIAKMRYRMTGSVSY